jgi:hypothetical protein
MLPRHGYATRLFETAPSAQLSASVEALPDSRFVPLSVLSSRPGNDLRGRPRTTGQLDRGRRHSGSAAGFPCPRELRVDRHLSRFQSPCDGTRRRRAGGGDPCSTRPNTLARRGHHSRCAPRSAAQSRSNPIHASSGPARGQRTHRFLRKVVRRVEWPLRLPIGAECLSRPANRSA